MFKKHRFLYDPDSVAGGETPPAPPATPPAPAPELSPDRSIIMDWHDGQQRQVTVGEMANATRALDQLNTAWGENLTPEALKQAALLAKAQTDPTAFRDYVNQTIPENKPADPTQLQTEVQALRDTVTQLQTSLQQNVNPMVQQFSGQQDAQTASQLVQSYGTQYPVLSRLPAEVSAQAVRGAKETILNQVRTQNPQLQLNNNTLAQIWKQALDNSEASLRVVAQGLGVQMPGQAPNGPVSVNDQVPGNPTDPPSDRYRPPRWQNQGGVLVDPQKVQGAPVQPGQLPPQPVAPQTGAPAGMAPAVPGGPVSREQLLDTMRNRRQTIQGVMP